jgi:uncharacterized protein
MRREEKEIHDPAEIEAVLAEARVCRIAMCDGGRPYVVPLCFGYRSGAFYVHSAAEGRKIDILKKNPEVCVEVEAGVAPVPGRRACDWGMRFRSVIAFGRVSFLEDDAARREGLDIIMAHYAPGEFEYPRGVLSKTAVLRVDVTGITGKRSGL